MKTIKIRYALALIAGILASGAAAQDQHLPATDIIEKDTFLSELPTRRIRMMYDGIGNDFLFELQDRDLANQFNYGLPPVDQTMEGSDMVVVVRDDWASLEQFWTTAGVDILADEVRPYIDLGDAAPFVVTTRLRSPQGHALRVYQFTRVAAGERLSERCMARMVIDDTYRGLDNRDFNAFQCSRDMP